MCVLIIFKHAKFRDICVALLSYTFYIYLLNDAWKLSNTYKHSCRSPHYRHEEMSFYQNFIQFSQF